MKRALAVYPSSRGFGFVLLEGSNFFVEWGIREARGRIKNWECRCKVFSLVRRFQPDVLLLEEIDRHRSKRCGRIRKLIDDLQTEAAKRKLRCVLIRQARVKAVFAEFPAVSKHEIASVIAGLCPELTDRLPPKRKPWMSEDPRMSIFQAAAMALTFYSDQEKRRKARK